MVPASRVLRPCALLRHALLDQFRVSVVTGIVGEFQFGMNWSAHLDPENRRALTANLLAATAGRAALLITYERDGLDQVFVTIFGYGGVGGR